MHYRFFLKTLLTFVYRRHVYRIGSKEVYLSQKQAKGLQKNNVYTLQIGGTLLVAQSVEALHYNSGGRGFDSRLCHWNFSLT